MGSYSRILSAPKLRLQVGMSLAEAERMLILATLEACEGNKRQAAELLGVSLKTVYNKLVSYGCVVSAATEEFADPGDPQGWESPAKPPI